MRSNSATTRKRRKLEVGRKDGMLSETGRLILTEVVYAKGPGIPTGSVIPEAEVNQGTKKEES